ncbi:hypothetical protein DPMN_059388 [Dreissena polymorpha]|uniref:Uncharacterized protein n=1 Tax=Dreissena polymorpha TaxID=45954 RepID=A0A9D4C3W8_DREPO|nr:hypothetical protein DPMN_059388 [Dreissena polymorpha]
MWPVPEKELQDLHEDKHIGKFCYIRTLKLRSNLKVHAYHRTIKKNPLLLLIRPLQMRKNKQKEVLVLGREQPIDITSYKDAAAKDRLWVEQATKMKHIGE